MGVGGQATRDRDPARSALARLQPPGDQAPNCQGPPASRRARCLCRRLAQADPGTTLDGCGARLRSRRRPQPQKRGGPLGHRGGDARRSRRQHPPSVRIQASRCSREESSLIARRRHHKPKRHTAHRARSNARRPGDRIGADDAGASSQRGRQARSHPAGPAPEGSRSDARRARGCAAASVARPSHVPTVGLPARASLSSNRSRGGAPATANQSHGQRIRGRFLLARARLGGRDRRPSLPPHDVYPSA